MGVPMHVDVPRRGLSGCFLCSMIASSTTRPQHHCSLQLRAQNSMQVQAVAAQGVCKPNTQQECNTRCHGRPPSSPTATQVSQRGLSAVSLLERAAAAPRHAVAPEQLQASTSSSSSSSVRNRHSSWSSRAHRAAAVHSSSMHDSWGSHHHEATAAAAAAVAATAEVSVVVSGNSVAHTAPPYCLVEPSHRHSPSTSTSSTNSSGDRPKRLSDDGWRLMQDIVHHTSSWQDLAQVVEQQAGDFTAPHCAAALYRLAALWQQQEQYVREQQPQMRAELRLQYPEVLKLAGVLLRALQQQVAAAEARELADALSALTKLGFRAQQHATHHGGVEGAGSSAIQQLNGSEVTAAADVIPAGFVEALSERSRALLLAGSVEPRHLSRVLWGFVQLEIQPSCDWWAVALDAAADRLQQQQQQQCGEADRCRDWFTPQGIAITGWAVAKLQAPASGAWWQCYMTTAAVLLPQMEPQHLCNCIWALATAQQYPSSSWMDGFYSATSRYLHNRHTAGHLFAGQNVSYSGSKPQGLANLLWALATLQQQPPVHWQQQFEAASASQLTGYSMQHLSMSLWAHAKINNNSSSSTSRHSQQQQQAPSAAWVDQFWVQLSMVESDATPQGVACILWALVQLGIGVPAQQLLRLERLVCAVLRDASPQSLAVMVWGMAVIRGPNTSRAVVKRVRRYCHDNQQQLAALLTPQGLVMLLYGLSRFNAWHPDWLKQQLLAAVTHRVQQGLQEASSSSSSSSSRAGFRACELPVILLSMVQLKITLPTTLLQKIDLQLLQQQGTEQQQQLQMDTLSAGQFSVCLFALGVARHHPSPEFMEAAAARVHDQASHMCGKDVAFVLYGFAAIASMGEQQPQQQQDMLQQLLGRAEQVLHDMDHRCLAMVMWSLARLQLRPSQQLLQHCLAATTAQLPSMTLLSVTTILAALQALRYLPPLPWVVETCKAARAKVNTDPSPQPYQRRACVRRLEEAVAWFNSVVQQQQQQEEEDFGSRGVQQRVADAVLKGAAGVLGAGNTSSEAVIAAAVGVAAAVAQQWRW